jgi:glucokinase
MMRLLAADIGGTYSRLAWRASEDPGDWVEQRFENAGFADLEAVIDRGLELLGASSRSVGCMVLALPGPVHSEPVRLTNIDWSVSRRALRERYAAARVEIVNDFQAAAVGAVTSPAGQLKRLNAGAGEGDGAVVVTGAGTGLGMAWFAGPPDGRPPHATEGGHLDFAPNDRQQEVLYSHLAERYGHVSYERILSGDGLLGLYRWLAGPAARADDPAGVTALAAAGDAAAVEAVRLFVRVFAAYAGNLALAFNPAGGIYLCGGLSAHLADWFEPAAFAAAFAAKGRMRELVGRIPVSLVTRADIGLAGARQLLDTICTRAET